MSNPMEVIKMALEREKHAVKLYSEFSKSAKEPEVKQLFLFLVEEEKKHVKLIQDEIEKETFQEM